MPAPPVLRIVEREARVFRRLWRGTVFSSFVQPLLFLAAIGIGLGELVDTGSGDVDGLSYLEFVTPGLLAASAVLLATPESLWPVMAGHKWIQNYHAMTATPVRPVDVFGGHVVWIMLRATMSATAFVVVAAVLGGVPSPWAVLAIPAAVLGAGAFAAPLTAYAATQDTDMSFSIIIRVGIIPLFLFSATFFPLSQLPDWLQPLAVLSPLYHSVELCRAATTGTADWTLPVHAALLAAIIALGRMWGARTFERRLAQ